MDKREKVIKGLEYCMVGDGHSPKCELCPYTTVGDDTCQTMDELFTDALALLKAHGPEAVDASKPDSDIGCWYDITHNYTLEQIVNALKAQEPRAMMLEEIQHTDAVWLETHGWKIQGGDIHETVLRRMSDFEDYVTEFVDNDDGDITCDNSKLGIDWRCWNIEPSDEQRKNTPWKE